MTDHKPILLTDLPIADIQARFPSFEVMAMQTEPAVLVGRDVRVMGSSGSDPKSIREVVETYAADRHFVAVRDTVEYVFGVREGAGYHSWVMRVAAVLKQMGWKRVMLREGRVRKEVYCPPVTPTPAALPTFGGRTGGWKDRPRGNHVRQS